MCMCGFCKRSSTNWAALALATLNLVSRSAAALPTRLRGGSSPSSLFFLFSAQAFAPTKTNLLRVSGCVAARSTILFLLLFYYY
jgi:hypothetical protein